MKPYFPTVAIAFMAASLFGLILNEHPIYGVLFVTSATLLAFLCYLDREQKTAIAAAREELSRVQAEAQKDLSQLRERIDALTHSVTQGLGF